MRRNLQLLFVLLVSFAIGCDSLPENLRNQVKQCSQDLQKVERVIVLADSSFRVFKKSGDYATFHSKYDKRENWSANFTAASSEFGQAGELFEGQISRFAERNASADVDSLKFSLGKLQKHLDAAADYAARPSRRIAQLSEARKSASKWTAEAEGKSAGLASSVGALGTLVSDAQSKYSWKRDDLAKRYLPAQKLRTDAGTALDAVQAQMRLAEADRDYAIIADGVVKIGQLAGAMPALDSNLRARISQLGRSYSKLLVDLKVVAKPYKELVRYEWSEFSDWDTSKETRRDKVYVSVNEYNQLAAQLRSNPDGIRLEGGEGRGYEVDLEEVDIDSFYYHQYLIEENGDTSRTSWTEVDEDVYGDNEDNLGMALLNKPLGYYEAEVQKVATPPGMAYVGNPNYGQWRSDGRGGSFWEFYGRYMLYRNLFGYPSYTRNDWNDWDRNYRGRQPYYGTSAGGEDRFGSASSATRTRFAGSSYARQGGFRSADPSVRGAGRSARGRGPGGGGK